MTHEKENNAHGAFFKVSGKYKGQKLILFERIESETMTRESSEDDFESLQFFHYGQNSHHMMEKMEYNLTIRSGLNFDKGKQALF